MQIRDTISPSLAKLAAGIENKKPILEAMGTQLASLTQRAFNEPDLRPAPWPAKRDGSPATLRKNQVLVRSIRITDLTNDSVTVSTDRLYAAIHQFGGEIRAKGKALRFQLGGKTIFAKKVKIPPRPFFPIINGQFTDQARDKIRRVGEEKIAALTKPPGS
ncbi:phage virion morphogenesis protein [Geminisphaera colitermitum]|uniref:phage virion morphogenesis protein n=1 Tax=Geminisphaera colitermitum TaxID=1148786 RepID=UPI000158CBA7|nr:phage virion morphogenesis protein [Geminisphaera colitermitum]